MDRKWSALCAALVAAHALLQAGAMDTFRTRFQATAAGRRNSGALWQTTESKEDTEFYSFPAGEEETEAPGGWTPPPDEPGETGPAEETAPSEETVPQETEAPAEEETVPPEEISEETPDETLELFPPDEPPEAAAEVRPFTDTPGVAIKNNTGFSVDIPALMAEELTLRLPREGPQILILHTHGTEAYLPVPGETYVASDPYRTTDAAHSVIRVGDTLAAALESSGLHVIHDTSLNDYPSYAGSYARSEAAAEYWLRQYPGIAVVIDLHRDAVGTEEVVYKTRALVAGEGAAQVMLVIGTGENGLEHPLWRENLKLALALQAAMDSASPTLTRPIHLARERYNQHLTTGSLILEVGTNGNTLSEAERAVGLFAAAAGPLLVSLVQDE